MNGADKDHNSPDGLEKPPLVAVIKPKRRLFPKIFWTAIIVFFIFFAFLFAKAYNFSSKIFVSNHSFFQTLRDLIFHSTDAPLIGQDTGKVNILLLGYGGVGHDGPYLTDTIIVASIDLDKKQVLLTSVPRDTYYAQGIGTKKINEAFSDGYLPKDDTAAGGALAEKALGNLSGLDIPYFATVDFQGFVKIVDRVGGLDINIDRTFTDNTYPNDATNGYLPPITFNKGVEHMDGQRALIYVRSRHAPGPEGSDFARSKRQQKVLSALREKAQSLNLATDSQTINDMLGIIADHARTNLSPAEMLHISKVLHDPQTKIVSQSLDPDTGLVCPTTLPSDGEFVVTPCNGVTSQDIKNFFQNGFATADVRSEQASVILENSGASAASYDSVKKQLQLAGVTIYEVAYRGIALPRTVLYEVSPKPATETFIESILGINRQPKPAAMTANSDLVLILGGQ